METTIARLIKAFEAGQMNRRQLIRSLAIVATGLHALKSPAPVAASQSRRAAFKTIGLDHISYSVADYGRSRDFYSDLMGWEVQSDDGERQASLRIGDVGTIIIRNSREPAAPSPGGDPPVTGVVGHIAWRIEDFETNAVRDELERRGLNPRRDQGGGPGYDSYHVLDPDGWDLQIS